MIGRVEIDIYGLLFIIIMAFIGCFLWGFSHTFLGWNEHGSMKVTDMDMDMKRWDV